MRGSTKDLSKVLDTEDAIFYEAVWGEMHVEYDIYIQNGSSHRDFLQNVPIWHIYLSV